MYEAVQDRRKMSVMSVDLEAEADKSYVEFSTSAVAVMEDVGTVQVMKV